MSPGTHDHLAEFMALSGYAEKAIQLPHITARCKLSLATKHFLFEGAYHLLLADIEIVEKLRLEESTVFSCVCVCVCVWGLTRCLFVHAILIVLLCFFSCLLFVCLFFFFSSSSKHKTSPQRTANKIHQRWVPTRPCAVLRYASLFCHSRSTWQLGKLLSCASCSCIFLYSSLPFSRAHLAEKPRYTHTPHAHYTRTPYILYYTLPTHTPLPTHHTAHCTLHI
jgi:hypothetical protein